MDAVKKFSSNMRWLFVGTIGSNIISVLVSIFLIRKLAVEDFGIYSLFMGSIGFFAVISNSGVLVSLRRFIPEIRQKKYYTYLKGLILKLSFVALSLTVICIVIVYFFKSEVGALLNIKKFDLYYSIFTINIFLFLQGSLAATILVSMYEQKVVSILNFISIAVRGILYAVFLSSITLEIIFIIEAISLSVVVIPEVIVIAKKIIYDARNSSLQITSTEKAENKKRISRYVLLSTSNEMGSSVLSEISDYYFISAFLGPVALGMYAFPYKIIKSVFQWIPLNQINNIVRPFFINKYYERGEDKKYLNDMFNFLLKIFILFYGVIIALIIAYQDLINIYLFKSKYVNTETLLLVILFFYMFRAITYPVSAVMEVTEKIQFNVYSKMFAVFNALAVYLILEFTSWGLFGVAAATGLSVFLKDYYIYYFMRKLTGVKINVLNLTKTITVVVSIIAVMFAASLFNILLLKLSLPILIGAVVAIIIYKALRPFNNTEEDILSKFINKLFPQKTLLSKIFAFVK